MRVWAFMADSCGELVIWCVGNLQHQRPTAMGRKSLIAWQGSEGAGGRGSRGGVPDGPFGYPARSRTLTRRCARSEEHTSELQSLMRTSYAVFCLKKNNTKTK